MASAIKNVTGVVDHGLFVMMTERVHVAGPNGVQTVPALPATGPGSCAAAGPFFPSLSLSPHLRHFSIVRETGPR